MKIKVLLLFAFLNVFYSLKPAERNNDEEIYSVRIFQWIKNENGEERKKVISINQAGDISLNNLSTNKTLNLKTFTKAMNNFVKSNKVVKEEANNDPPKVAPIPKRGEQFIGITIIKLKDFVAEKEFANHTRYVSRNMKKSSDENIEIYDYLNSDDLKKLKSVIN